MTSTGYFCGFNGFNQFGSKLAKQSGHPTEFSIDFSNSELKSVYSWPFNVFAFRNEIIITGFVEGQSDNRKSFKTEHPVKSLTSNDNFCLFLLSNGDINKLNVRNGILEKINFLNVERGPKRNIFGEVKELIPNVVEHIACGIAISVAITKDNVVYNIPSKIYEFSNHIKVKSLVCGFEHALVLTSNGDVYSWGNGLRGQLGHSDVRSEEIPMLIDALAGVKIVNISAGGWHSAAVSAFGDLYTWGSNINGQLGIKVYKQFLLSGDENFSRKNPTVFPLPQIVEIQPCCENTHNTEEESEPCNVEKVSCGARHTFIQNTCGKILCCGWNEHGQLGLDLKDEFKDSFVINKSELLTNCKISCGSWCTVFIKSS